MPALATALVYGVGGYLAINGTVTVGTLLALATLLLRLLGPLQGLSNVRIDVMTALVSFERVFEVLDLPSLVQEKPDAIALPAAPSRLEFDHVAFTYPRADEVSLASLETRRPHRVARPAARCSTTSPSSPSPARWSRWSGRPGPARPRSPTWSPASTTPLRRGAASAATTCAT